MEMETHGLNQEKVVLLNQFFEFMFSYRTCAIELKRMQSIGYMVS